MHHDSSDEDDGAPRVVYCVEKRDDGALASREHGIPFTQVEVQRAFQVHDDDDGEVHLSLREGVDDDALHLAPSVEGRGTIDSRPQAPSSMSGLFRQPAPSQRPGGAGINARLQLPKMKPEKLMAPRGGKQTASSKPVMSNVRHILSHRSSTTSRNMKALTSGRLRDGGQTSLSFRPESSGERRRQTPQPMKQVLQLSTPGLELGRTPPPTAGQTARPSLRPVPAFPAFGHPQEDQQASTPSTFPTRAVTPASRQHTPGACWQQLTDQATTPSMSPAAGAANSGKAPRLSIADLHIPALPATHLQATASARKAVRTPELPGTGMPKVAASSALFTVAASSASSHPVQAPGCSGLHASAMHTPVNVGNIRRLGIDTAAGAALMSRDDRVGGELEPSTPLGAQDAQQAMLRQRIAHRTLLCSLPKEAVTPQSASPPSKRPRVQNDQLSRRLQALKAKLARAQQSAAGQSVEQLEGSEAACLRCAVVAAPLVEDCLFKLWCQVTSGAEHIPARPSAPVSCVKPAMTPPSSAAEGSGRADCSVPHNAGSMLGSGTAGECLAGPREVPPGQSAPGALQHAFVYVDKDAADSASLCPAAGSRFAVYKHWSTVWLPECSCPVILAFVVVPDV